ncbi:MAG: AtpZ/AtpI family protein [Cytophagales bacterium]|nr:AtpZ/AtpI family protein [Cytophagales bacterium]
MSLPEKKKALNPYLKYSSLAIQMTGTILIFAWVGRWADEYMHTEKPILTIVCLLIGTVGSMYMLIKQLS